MDTLSEKIKETHVRGGFPGAEQTVVRPWRRRYGLAVVYSIFECFEGALEEKKLKWKRTIKGPFCCLRHPCMSGTHLLQAVCVAFQDLYLRLIPCISTLSDRILLRIWKACTISLSRPTFLGTSRQEQLLTRPPLTLPTRQSRAVVQRIL
jgi:hypothetical protein